MRKWIICCGPDWYRPSVSSTEQLMQQFLDDGWRVLWINPIAFRSPFGGSSSSSSVSAWRKIRNKLRTHLNFLRHPSARLWVCVPLYIPAFSRRGARINRMLIRGQFRLLRLLFGIRVKRAVLWCTPGVTALPLLDRPFRARVYEAHDLLSAFRTESESLRARLRDAEKQLCMAADARFAASEHIRQGLLELAEQRKVHLLPHGVNIDRFSPEGPVAEAVEQIRRSGRPVAGYFGSLSDANDKDAFLALAEDGFSVVVIGKILGDYSALEAHPHIHFPGPVAYERLPAYARGFDVGLLNWRAGEWITNCFPLKTLEYLALGLPVVACPIPIVEKRYGDWVYTARSPQEFVTQARRAIGEDDEKRRAARRAAVKDQTWAARYETVKEVIDELAIPDH
ncbi:glycosyltransferase [Kiritimatiella glycovorans]|uniref:Glycosyl transferase family 2 n=1 Tax=Kiritimatiella glycovorans TaxID=1307763 RepID=A0A0G3EGC2_9BACT|nr:glycosyltransferase [Kiritimatiella glycovorans]AKJ65516.1 Glycosyl transferase family 2 [Kiritimatiella glycovorans]